MRYKILLVILATVFSVNTYAQEAETAAKPKAELSTEPTEAALVDMPKNTFYLHPIDLLQSTLKVSYEREFGKNSNGIMITAGLLLRDGPEIQEMGFGGEIHLRLTILKAGKSKKFNLKLFASPFLSARYIDRGYTYENCLVQDPITFECTETEEIGQSSYVRNYGAGLVAGVKMTFIQKIVIGVHIGGQARYAEHTPFENTAYESYFNDSMVSSDFFPLSVLNEIDMDATRTGIFPMVGFQVGFAF